MRITKIKKEKGKISKWEMVQSAPKEYPCNIIISSLSELD